VGLLCAGGAIKYKYKRNVAITDEWLFANVCPNIRRCFPNDSWLCKVLGMAMLWCALDQEASKLYISQGMRDRITQAYIPTHPEISQPIDKVALNIYRIEDTLMIHEIPAFDGNGNGGGNCWKMLCNAGGYYTMGLVCLLLVWVLSIQDLMIQSY
jgi:hypothetical protein